MGGRMSGVKSGVLCLSSLVLLCTRGAVESKSRQQLDRCMAATVWAARHHSNRPMHHSLSLLAAWKPHQCTITWRHWLQPKNQRGMSMSWNGIWRKYGQQPAELQWSIEWLFYCVSQSQKQTLWTFVMMCFSMICNCHDFWSLHYRRYEQIDLRFVSQGRVEIAVRRGGRFCCSFVVNLLQYPGAKNY